MDNVEKSDITIYRLRLFTIFNSFALALGSDKAVLQTDQEQENEFDDQIEYYKSKGFFNG